MNPSRDDIAKARDSYFARAQYQYVFDKLPRVAEIFDTIEAHRGERVAMLHMHAAFVLVNHTSFLRMAGKLTGLEPLAQDLLSTLTRHMFMSVDLDTGHMTSLVRAIQDDGKDVMAEMAKRL